jgi:hypothetical protein
MEAPKGQGMSANNIACFLLTKYPRYVYTAPVVLSADNTARIRNPTAARWQRWKAWFTLIVFIAVGSARGGGPLPAPEAPVLLVLNTNYVANPFTGYLSEILRSEGLVEFQEVEWADLSAASNAPAFLGSYSLVLLGETDLTAAQEQLLRQYVWSGGRLIAMRPSSNLADLFGLSYLGSRAEQLLEFYAIDTTRGPGAGLAEVSLQYHGPADNYALSGATPLAYLWDAIDSSSANPALVLHGYGAGQAAAFTFDLARSIVLLRQGNPEWKDSEGDGLSGYRPADTFFRLTGEKWIAPERMRIPQADEAQRLLANLVQSLCPQPLPRLWYLPAGNKAIMINTGDGESWSGAQFEPILSDIARYGGRLTLYLRDVGIAGTDAAEEASWRAAGHETGPHVYGGGPDTYDALAPAYAQIVASLQAKFGHGARTARNHTIDWCGWVSMAAIEADNGTQLDANYYHYLPFLQGYGGNANGYFTGSGLPQRLCDQTGNLLPVYQALTEWPDEWFVSCGNSADQVVQLIQEMFLTAQTGNYSAFVANTHPSRYGGTDITHAWANRIWAYCQSNGIPMWTAEKLLDFVQARNAARFDHITWNGTNLAFDFTAPISGQDLTILLPARVGVTNQLLAASFAGNPVACSIETLKGREYAWFTTRAGAGQVIATYARDLTPPRISNLRVESVTPTTATIAWSTDEPANSRLDYGVNAANLVSQVSSAVLATEHRLELGGLSPGTTYYYQVSSADAAGNPVSSPVLDFATLPLNWLLTTTHDFAGGALEGLVVSEDSDGELRLQPSFYDWFWDNSLSSLWTNRQWNGSAFSPVVADGLMTLTNAGGGSYVRSVAVFQPGTTVQARLKFSRSGSTACPYVYFGLAGTNLSPWALIGTAAAGDQVYTSVYNRRPGDPVLSGLGNLFGQWHDYKVVWQAEHVEFWVDGALRRTESVSLAGPLFIFFSTAANTPSSASLAGDWVRVENYGTNQDVPLLVLSDSFNGPDGPATNWTSLPNPKPSTGVWSVVSHALQHSAAGSSYHPAVLTNTFPALTNFNLQARAMSSSTVGFFGLVWGLQDSTRFYMVQFYPNQGMRVYRTDNWFTTCQKLVDEPTAPTPSPGTWFTLRLEARNGTFRLYVNGVLQGTVTDQTYPGGRVGVMGYGGATTYYDDVLVERVESVPTPYGQGDYTSVVFDSGWKTAWQGLSWTGSTPAGTTLNFQTRSGNTPGADASWSAWQPLASPIASPESRYFQFRAYFSTTNALLSPVVEQVRVNFAPVQESPPLTLGFAESGGLTLRWPSWAGGLMLSSATNLTPPVVWRPVSGDRLATNGCYQQILGASNRLEVFRLATP